jgi:hypothetical protein
VNIVAKTFIKDRFIRDEKGVPIGRCVLIDDSDYEEGKSLPVALITLPTVYYVTQSHVYIDGTAYRLPEDVIPVRKSSRGSDIILNNVTLNPEDV